jgi:hypothetical protein
MCNRETVEITKSLLDRFMATPQGAMSNGEKQSRTLSTRLHGRSL